MAINMIAKTTRNGKGITCDSVCVVNGLPATQTNPEYEWNSNEF